MTRGSAFAFAAGLAVFLLGASAKASPVYAGCETPGARPSAHVFFVDPARGSPQGDGSRGHPWRTLAEVVRDGKFATAPILHGSGVGPIEKAEAAVEKVTGVVIPRDADAPIKPGDTVYLLGGDHGSVKLQGAFGRNLVGYANSDFITIEALSGQTPIIRQLLLIGGSKWVFRGLTFKGLNDTGSQLRAGPANSKDYTLVVLAGPHDNIVLDHDHILSAEDVSSWTKADWISKRASAISDSDGECIAITANTIENVGFGLGTQRSNKVLVSDNLINNFSDDGIDYGSDNLLIDHNRITNSVEDGDGIHRDAMQGQPVTMDAVVKNVTISNNTVIRVADKKLKEPAYLQGIDTFDGVWQNVKVINNIVITDAGHGISYYGAHNLLIRGNILLGDGMEVLPCSHISFEQCLTASVIVDKGQPPRIVVTHGKSGDPSSDVLITQNITTGIALDPGTLRQRVANNLCVSTNGKCVIGIPEGGKLLWAATPGAYGDHNVISPMSAVDLFVKFDPKNFQYDIRLKKPMFKKLANQP